MDWSEGAVWTVSLGIREIAVRRQLGLDDAQHLVRGEIVVDVTAVGGEEAPGAVAGGLIEDEIAHPVLLKKEEVEFLGHARDGDPLVGPSLGRIDGGQSDERLLGPRLPQDDVDLAPVRLPAGLSRPDEALVGVGDAAGVLFAELVLFGPLGRVAMAPEGLDEEIPVPAGREIQENLALGRGDDEDDLLLEPEAVFLGQGPGLSGEEAGGGQERDRSGEPGDGCFHGRITPHDNPAADLL